MGGYRQGGNLGAWDIRGMGRGSTGTGGETPRDVPARPEYPGRPDHHGDH